MHTLVISNQAKRDLKKLDKPIIKKILLIFEEIAENPYLGESLIGDFSHLKKWSFHYSGISYRIAYKIANDKIEVQIMQVGTRENFYNELKRRR